MPLLQTQNFSLTTITHILIRHTDFLALALAFLSFSSLLPLPCDDIFSSFLSPSLLPLFLPVTAAGPLSTISHVSISPFCRLGLVSCPMLLCGRPIISLLLLDALSWRCSVVFNFVPCAFSVAPLLPSYKHFSLLHISCTGAHPPLGLFTLLLALFLAVCHRLRQGDCGSFFPLFPFFLSLQALFLLFVSWETFCPLGVPFPASHIDLSCHALLFFLSFYFHSPNLCAFWEFVHFVLCAFALSLLASLPLLSHWEAFLG